MRKVIAFEFLSVDGFMAGPTGSEMDFVVSGFNTEMEQNLASQYQELDAFIMGRTTFQSLASYWPTAASEDELLREQMNSMQKLVCSTTLKEPQWQNSRVLPTDAANEIRHIKTIPGKDIMIIGSAKVVQNLTNLRLIDEFRFFIFPVIVGTGKALFSKQTEPVDLKLLGTRHFDTGVVRVDYACA